MERAVQEGLGRVDERMTCVERDVTAGVPSREIPALLEVLDRLRAQLREAVQED